MLASLSVKYRCLLTVYFSCAYTFLLGRQLAKHPNEAPSLGSRETSEEAICPEFGITMMSIYIYLPLMHLKHGCLDHVQPIREDDGSEGFHPEDDAAGSESSTGGSAREGEEDETRKAHADVAKVFFPALQMSWKQNEECAEHGSTR